MRCLHIYHDVYPPFVHIYLHILGIENSIMGSNVDRERIA